MDELRCCLTFDLCAEDHGIAGAEGFICLERTY
jgi:hypothetical protein